MKSHKWVRTLRRAALPIVVGGAVFQLGGCDPNVRNALLSGLQTTVITLLTTLVNTFFLSLQAVTTPTSQQTVEAVFEQFRRVVA